MSCVATSDGWFVRDSNTKAHYWRLQPAAGGRVWVARKTRGVAGGGGEMSEERYAQWSILELLGHRRLAGWVTEQEIAGKGFLRIDIPRPEPLTPFTQFYSPDSVYGLTPTTEAIARRVAAQSTPAPVQTWELKLPAGERVIDCAEPDHQAEPEYDEDEIPL